MSDNFQKEERKMENTKVDSNRETLTRMIRELIENDLKNRQRQSTVDSVEVAQDPQDLTVDSK
jgi:predicted transglutaminase-like protease